VEGGVIRPDTLVCAVSKDVRYPCLPGPRCYLPLQQLLHLVRVGRVYEPLTLKMMKGGKGKPSKRWAAYHVL
jgi:hypothetical protein